jgi:hypothetical protein
MFHLDIRYSLLQAMKQELYGSNEPPTIARLEGMLGDDALLLKKNKM